MKWDVEINLLTNMRIWRDLVRVAAITFALAMGLMAFVFAPTGEWEIVGHMALFFALGIVALLGLGLLILTALTGNHFLLSYEINDAGVSCTVTDPRAQAITVGSGIVGLALGSLQATATSLITAASSHRIAPWENVTRVARSNGAIDLYGSWRSLLVVYCPPGRDDDIGTEIARHMQVFSGVQSTGPSLAGLLTWSALVTLASLTQFALPYPFDVHLLTVILLLGFGWACVWLLPPFGLIEMVLVAIALVDLGFDGVERHSGSFLNRPYDHSGFEMLRGDEWGVFGICVASLVFLGWFGWASFRGKGPSARHHVLSPGHGD